MPPVKLKANIRPWSPMTTEAKFDAYDIRKLEAVDIANELTLINQTLLLRIEPEELCDFAFLSTDKNTLAPNVTLMLEFYERAVLLFATQILKHKTYKDRASVIVHFCSVIQQLYVANHDIHSIRILLATFDHPSIFRLRETWRIFRRENTNFYTALKYLWNVLSQENNWADYRLWLEEKFVKDCMSKNQPMLLFLGYLLSKMVTDHYRFYQLSPTARENESSARVHRALVEYIESAPKQVLLRKTKNSETDESLH